MAKRFSTPPDSLEQYVEERGLGRGNPLMAPFANRIDKDYYYFEGRKYLLNGDLGNFLRTSPTNFPIHGLLSYDKRWEVVKTNASDSTGAAITSRMDFYKYPDLMAQFPFAHIHEVTYRLKGGNWSAPRRSPTWEIPICPSIRLPPIFCARRPARAMDAPRGRKAALGGPARADSHRRIGTRRKVPARMHGER